VTDTGLPNGPPLSATGEMPRGASTTSRAAFAFWASALGSLALDLWTKSWAFALLHVRSEGIPPRVVAQQVRTVVPHFFEMEATYNYGAVAGSFGGHSSGLVVISAAVVLVLLGTFLYNLWRHRVPELLLVVATGLLVGGIGGNLHDRIAYGAVRDWIRWFVVVGSREHVWPNFNIADAAICAAVGLLLLREIRRARRDRTS
jgi:signal peptidase II